MTIGETVICATYGVDRPCRFPAAARVRPAAAAFAEVAAALPALDCAFAADCWPAVAAETGTDAAPPRLGGGGVATNGLPTAVPGRVRPDSPARPARAACFREAARAAVTALALMGPYALPLAALASALACALEAARDIAETPLKLIAVAAAAAAAVEAAVGRKANGDAGGSRRLCVCSEVVVVW